MEVCAKVSALCVTQGWVSLEPVNRVLSVKEE